MSEKKYYYGTGRRKTAVARVRLYLDDNTSTLNGAVYYVDVHVGVLERMYQKRLKSLLLRLVKLILLVLA